MEPFHPGSVAPQEGDAAAQRSLPDASTIVCGALEIESIRQLRMRQAYLDNWRKYSEEERRGAIEDRER